MKPIVLCGPTASGKTEIALELARQTDGIIISADSRQVYQRLTVGTAKPQGTWENGRYLVNHIPYHLVDFLDVRATFNAGAFCQQVQQIVHENTGRQLIFAGGTGLYLHAYFVGMDPLPGATAQTRAWLENLLRTHGKEGLHRLLQERDPASAAQIPPGNIHRTMRALELCELTGRPASALKSGNFFKLPDPQQAHWVYLVWEREQLASRIKTRTEQIFDGMCQEASQLLTEGFPADTAALKSLGYPQAAAYIQGKISRQSALEKIIILTRQYAKRQRTWFNRYTQAQRIELTAPADFEPSKITRKILSA